MSEISQPHRVRDATDDDTATDLTSNLSEAEVDLPGLQTPQFQSRRRDYVQSERSSIGSVLFPSPAQPQRDRSDASDVINDQLVSNITLCNCFLLMIFHVEC